MAAALDLAYLAGIIDADGYVTIHRSQRAGRFYFAPAVGIAGTRSEPHELASSIWGGTVGRHGPYRPGTRPIFSWSRQGKAAAIVLADLLPYLRIKRRQAGIGLDLAEHLADGHDPDAYPWAVAGWDPTPSRQAFYEDCVILNEPRNRRTGLALPLVGAT